MANKKILITGGAGFVGSFLTEQLLKDGPKEIFIIDNLIRGSYKNIQGSLDRGPVTFIEGDIRDELLLEDVFSRGVDVCFHLAALRITHCASDPKMAREVMYDGTFNILEKCVRHNIEKLILASSASIYGQAEEFPTTEQHHPYNNRTLYGAAKMANELMCRSFSEMHGLKYNALRYFNIYGPRMDTHGKYTEVLVRWYRLIKEGKAPVIYGDGKQTMDFIFVEEIARATKLALTAKVEGEVFNIASGVETSLEELCLLLIQVMGATLKPTYIPLPEERKKVEVMRRLADVSKAKMLLDFESSVDLKEGLSRLVSWLDQQVSQDNLTHTKE
ncbi:MAG: NAD-dependent epimerase/dehydratase family protein [Candidatus Omnitrophica bacterium]|nr:NAD-dependent epimerase/dehydratase family protein [Candidatus Omnitrophota bacterium]